MIRLLTFSGTVKGLGHLWYISTILFCYFLTPVFHSFMKAFFRLKRKQTAAVIVLSIIVIHISVSVFFTHWNPAWINCFFLGMLYSRMTDDKTKRIAHIIVISSAVIMNAVQIYFDYVLMLHFDGLRLTLYSIWCDYAHAALGIALVIALRNAWQNLQNKRSDRNAANYILQWSDQYSYDIYLTHHVFILGAFSLSNWIVNPLLAIIMMLVCSAVSALVLNKLAGVVRK